MCSSMAWPNVTMVHGLLLTTFPAKLNRQRPHWIEKGCDNPESLEPSEFTRVFGQPVDNDTSRLSVGQAFAFSRLQP